MRDHNEEIERLKARVSCAAVLEQTTPPWRLDRAESSRRSLKYRRGPGEILIVSHGGRGWWDPLSDARGDIFALVRHLDPGLSFGDARRRLRGFAGLAPALPEMPRGGRLLTIPAALRWSRRPRLSRGSAAWHYLTRQRALPACILAAADAVDAVREGPRGTAWFAHRDAAGDITGIEMRGPAWRGFSAGGDKALFRLPGGPGPLPRLAVCEAAIDALSLAALERLSPDTLYTATAGGMGPATVAAITGLLRDHADDPARILIAATDADAAGRRHAARLAALAVEAGARFAAILPPEGCNDWNDALRAGASRA